MIDYTFQRGASESVSWSDRILTINLIATIMVVSIHYVSAEWQGGHKTWNALFQTFLAEGISRVAVPTFALLSGLFFFRGSASVEKYRQKIAKRVKTLLIPYLIGALTTSIIYYALRHGSKNIPPNDFSSFIIGAVFHPIAFQLWFIRDLIFVTLLSPVLFFPKFAVANWTVGAVYFIAWALEYQPFPLLAGWYLINIETLFFFWIGSVVASYDRCFNTLFVESNRRAGVALGIIWLVLILWRIVIDPAFDLWYKRQFDGFALALYKSSIVVGIFVISFLAPVVASPYFRRFARYTFFVYIFHTEPLNFVISRLVYPFVEMDYQFYFTFPAALALTFMLGHVSFRYLPQVSFLIDGGRTARRSEMAEGGGRR